MAMGVGVKKNRGRNYGHLKGLETVKEVVKNSIQLNIPIITFFVFSTENWKRPKKEINFLFDLVNKYFSLEIKNVIKEGIKLNVLGELRKLPKSLKHTLNRSTLLTRNNKKITVNLAINYGSRNEIINTLKKIKNKITLSNFEKNLYLKNIPNPDILIRTGGHSRLSNFMLWQLAYTELYFINKLWPDFKRDDLAKVIKKYKNTKRNFGSI